MNNFENQEGLYEVPSATHKSRIAFAKEQDEKRQWHVEAYRKIRLDKDLGWIYERIAEDIDIDDYS